ncbi:MAG: hypothetical protein LBQ87_09980, partial [Candidatus Fibromonas sp.]|nr:hypothetical protein [Candidatus Fibromonas sp.]
MSKIVSKFAFTAGLVLAMVLTFSCSAEAGQSDFYGVWVEGSDYFEINKESITRFKVYDNNDIEKHKYRIVKWEKKSDKNFIVYALDEDNK